MGTVKVATLIFIPGRGSVISTAQEWKSGSIYWLRVKKLLEPGRPACIS